jgi:hypothetical protein
MDRRRAGTVAHLGESSQRGTVSATLGADTVTKRRFRRANCTVRRTCARTEGPAAEALSGADRLLELDRNLVAADGFVDGQPRHRARRAAQRREGRRARADRQRLCQGAGGSTSLPVAVQLRSATVRKASSALLVIVTVVDAV